MNNNISASADKNHMPILSEGRHKYGQYGWVCLSNEEIERLVIDLGPDEVARCIAYIDKATQATGNKNNWKDWNLVIRKCSKEDWEAKRTIARSPEAIFRMIADRQCRRHQAERGEDWPTFSAPAVSRYPNILAELDGSGRWLDYIARCAEVSQPIMAAVMVNNGELKTQELSRLAQSFGCKPEYLASPELSLVDPSTNKGRARLRRLKELVAQTEGLDCFLYRIHSKDVLPALERGQPVTYAAYRWACRNLQDVLEQRARDVARQQLTRTTELPEAKTAGLDVQVQLARAKAELRKRTTRLAEIRKFAASVKVGEEYAKAVDLFALETLSAQDLFSAFILAINYGRAIGYKAAKGEL